MATAKEYRIIMTVCVEDNPVDMDTFMDMFIDWVEQNKWYAGGGFEPVREVENEKEIKP